MSDHDATSRIVTLDTIRGVSVMGLSQLTLADAVGGKLRDEGCSLIGLFN